MHLQVLRHGSDEEIILKEYQIIQDIMWMKLFLFGIVVSSVLINAGCDRT